MTDTMDGQTDLQGLFTRRVNIIAALSLGLIAIAPFLSNTGLTYSWSYLKLFALQTAVLITWAGLLIVRPARVKDVFRASGVGLPIALILVWGVLSRLWSSAPWAAVQPLIELATMGLAVIGLANLFAHRQVRRWFTIAYGCCAGLACLVYAWLKLGADAEAQMTVYPFDNPNVAAAFAILPMTVGASYAAAAFRRRSRDAGILGGVVAVVCAVAIVVSGSMAALIAGIGSLVLVGVFAFPGKMRKRLLIGLAILAVLGLLLVVFVLSDTDWFAAHLGSRPAMWKGGMALVAKAPVWGLGLGSFPVEYTSVYPLEYAAHELWSPVVLKAHSLPLHIVAELGIVGLAFAAALIFFAARTANAAARSAHRRERILLRGLVCGCLGMLAQGLVGMPLHYIEGYVNLVLAVALIGGLSNSWRRPTPPGDESPSLIRYAAPVVLVALCIVSAWPGLLSQIYQHQGMQAPNNSIERVERFEKAISTGHTTLWMLEAYGELVNVHGRRSEFELALEQLETVNDLAPNLGKFKMTEAEVRLKLVQSGTARTEEEARLKLAQFTMATQAIVAYCRKDPFNPRAYWIWRDILLDANKRRWLPAAQPQEAVRLLSIAERTNCRRLPKSDIQKMKPLFLRAAAALKGKR